MMLLQTPHSRPTTTAAVVVVRSEADVPLALRTIPRLLQHRGMNDAANPQILGILVGENFSRLLEGTSFENATSSSIHIRFREAVALSGIWSLCWFDFISLDEDRGADPDHLLQTLASLMQAHIERTSPPNAFARFDDTQEAFISLLRAPASSSSSRHRAFPEMMLESLPSRNVH